MAASLFVFYTIMCVAFCTAWSSDIPELTQPFYNVLPFKYGTNCSSAPKFKNSKASVALRKTGEHVFLLVTYSCKKNYRLKNPKKSELYCQNGVWVGEKPTCIKKRRRSTKQYKNCRIDDGGCAHICNKYEHKCECYDGYFLNTTDLSSCEDIDECKESNGGCSQKCINLPGQFLCSCIDGFEIDENDEQTCLDIDECANPELSWDCTAGCENLNGTYKCLPSIVGRVEPPDGDPFIARDVVCLPGFKVSADETECQDINECDLEDIDPDSGQVIHRYCEHKCENTIGSYICHCPQGYHLLDDRQSCIFDSQAPLGNPQTNITTSDMCPQFKVPTNGMASCYKYLENGFNHTRCNITCNAGYVLEGSQFASCGHTGIWSSPETKCVYSLALSCPALKSPSHGSFVPASCHNGPSKPHAICEVSCDRGYLPTMDVQLHCAAPRGWIQRIWVSTGARYVFYNSVNNPERCRKIGHP
ncbi:P-selectin [Drosophila erecta]|nr:P-selectin [Drosophila erecta]